jgi:hypothetical protein
VYRVTITWLDDEPETVFFPVEAYEVKNGVLTLALSTDQDLVIPLQHVKIADIERE